MLMANFLKNRRSVREFRKKKIEEKKLEKVQKAINSTMENVKDINVEITLHRDGEEIYSKLEGLAGYTGVMIKSPSYIGLKIKDNDYKTEVKASYHMEELITSLNYIALEACWITLRDVDKRKRVEVFGEDGEKMDYLLALGYPPIRNPFSGQVETLSTRKPIEHFVFKDEIDKSMDVEEMEMRGLYELFYYIRFAPSTKNSQPWRFLVEKDRIVVLLAREEGLYSYIDGGVISYYLQEMVNSMGIEKNWNFLEKEEYGENYEAIGYVKI